MDQYRLANRANWNERASLHAAKETGYKTQRYIDDKALISDVVRFDRERLGDLRGKNLAHLQCHIGTDSLSLARLGAHVTGLDFSEESVAQARSLVAETGDQVDFVVSDVYKATEALTPESFDFVYTSIGVLTWLSDIKEWAKVVSSLLKPGGNFLVRDTHPILWTIDETVTDSLYLRFPYFETEQPLEWDDESTYVDVDGSIGATKTYEWNHSLGEIVTALIDAGMVIDELVEHDSIPWEALPGQMIDAGNGEYKLSTNPPVLPLSFTVRAHKAD